MPKCQQFGGDLCTSERFNLYESASQLLAEDTTIGALKPSVMPSIHEPFQQVPLDSDKQILFPIQGQFIEAGVLSELKSTLTVQAIKPVHWTTLPFRHLRQEHFKQ